MPRPPRGRNTPVRCCTGRVSARVRSSPSKYCAPVALDDAERTGMAGQQADSDSSPSRTSHSSGASEATCRSPRSFSSATRAFSTARRAASRARTGLRRFLRNVHQLEPAGPRAPPHAAAQGTQRRGVEFPRRLAGRPQSPAHPPAPHGPRNVGSYDRDDAVVKGDFPALDTIEKRHDRRARCFRLNIVHAELAILHQLGSRDFREIGPPETLFRDVRRRHRPRLHHGVLPAGRLRQRVLRAQPM